MASHTPGGGALPLPPNAAGLVPAAFRPTTELSVAFGDKAVRAGTFLRKSECSDAPRVSFGPESPAPAAADPTYTLFLVDPDAPYPHDPKFANWRHWVVTGLRPAAVGGRALTEYLAPGPKDDSPPHRYIFQLFREPEGGLAHLTKADIGGEEFVERRSFDSVKWAADHRLELVAVNWMMCAADVYQEGS